MFKWVKRNKRDIFIKKKKIFIACLTSNKLSQSSLQWIRALSSIENENQLGLRHNETTKVLYMKCNKPASCLLLHQTHERIRSNSALSSGTLPQLGPLGRTSQHKNIQVFALKSSLSIEREDNIRNRKQLGRPKKEGKNRGVHFTLHRVIP